MSCDQGCERALLTLSLPSTRSVIAMSALANELMADLDGLSDEDYNEEPEEPESSRGLKRKAATDPDDVMSEDGEGEADGETEGPTGMVLEGGVKPAEELDSEEVQRMELSTVDDVRKVARLEGSRRMSEILSVCFFSCCVVLRLTFWHRKSKSTKPIHRPARRCLCLYTPTLSTTSSSRQTTFPSTSTMRFSLYTR